MRRLDAAARVLLLLLSASSSLVLWQPQQGPVLAAAAAAAAAVETPLPLGQLRHLPPPRHYVAHTCQDPITLDGHLDEPCWQAAPRSEAFVDIVGPEGPTPWHATHVRLLWSQEALLIAAELEDPAVWADDTHVHDRCVACARARAWLGGEGRV
jgi:hypothetical protein